MKKYAVVLAAVVLYIFASMVSINAFDITWDDIGRGNLNLRTVLVDPDNPQDIFIGSRNAVLKTEDGGKSWRNILLVKGQNKVVNFLLFDPKDKNSLYAATQAGLFHSANRGKSWNRIFKGKNYLESECTSIAVLPHSIYLGTKAGLFVSIDRGRSWHRESGRLGNNHILAIAYHLREPNYIYIACVEGVFRTEGAGQSWENIFVASPTDNNRDDEENIEEQDEESRVSDIRYITIDPKNLNRVYLATTRGVYISQDRGKTWQRLTSYGLLNSDTRFLLVSDKSNLYAVTKSAVFEYKEDRWQEISLGLIAQEVRFLALDNQDNLYAACDKGLFKAKPASLNKNKSVNILAVYYHDEPSINAVQQAAIKYAEVEPEKIAAWRRQAAKKAWLPRVSVGLDRNVTDLWHWEGGSTTKVDDDFLRKGRDAIEWDINLSWDLGDLIYNSAQTSIDVRSKLMVQLRDDILDEVTKIYFERLRVKMELDNLSIEDRKKRFEKELRLQELTAYLDGLTGGYFSSQIKGKF